ncbi:hypothetical protein CGRA01v4_00469 [Colletotrichum graminicola]|nr:hypothetical protein CGRA01v4_00469 [Colletotrichum graminicola]
MGLKTPLICIYLRLCELAYAYRFQLCRCLRATRGQAAYTERTCSKRIESQGQGGKATGQDILKFFLGPKERSSSARCCLSPVLVPDIVPTSPDFMEASQHGEGQRADPSRRRGTAGQHPHHQPHRRSTSLSQCFDYHGPIPALAKRVFSHRLHLDNKKCVKRTKATPGRGGELFFSIFFLF